MIRISVCLATYNGEAYISEQITSILKQLKSDDELIISDDSSTDDTINIIQSFSDERIKIFQNRGQKGVTHNFENALKNSRGQFIFLSDQDDIWSDDKVEKTLHDLKTADCILHNAELIDSIGNTIGMDLFTIYRTRTGYLNNLIRNTFVGCCMAFRRELLQYILPIPRHIKMHDMWIALLAEKKGKTNLQHSKLIFYRRHDNNASTTSQKSGFSKFFQLKYRLQMLFYTLLR